MPIARVNLKNKQILAVALVTLSHVNIVQAQAIFDPSTWFNSGPEADKQRQQELKPSVSTREYKSMQIGPWLVDSSASLGVVHDSNLYSSRFNARSATGFNISPTISGRYTDGVQNTNLFLDGSLSRYSVDGDLTTFGGRLGVANSVEIQRGMIWKALAQIGRTQDDGSAYNATGQGSDSSGVYVKPINSNSLFAATSVLSRIDTAQFTGFWSTGVSANLTKYEDAELSTGSKISQSARDANVYTATGRLGWSFAPTAYAFMEPSVALQKTPSVSNGDTTTYRLTAGLGTDRINLMQGEIFAGYARQTFNDLTGQPQEGGVYGGRLSWFPTRDITVNITGDDSIGVTSTADNSGAIIVSPSRTKSIGSDVNYLIDRQLTAAARIAYSNVNYSDTGRNDDVLKIGFDMTYMITGNFGLRGAYSNYNVRSSNDLNNLDRNVYTVGLTARF